jgi:tetratricopeptide (TPR) repeat protein
MAFQRSVLVTLFIVFAAAPLFSQDPEQPQQEPQQDFPAVGGVCGGTAPNQTRVQGRVIAPGADFDRYHEIVQLDEGREVGFGYTGSTGEYRLPPQNHGYYYIVLRIDGFKEYKERMNIWSCDGLYDHFIFLEPEEETIRPVILDFTGEVNEAVDVTELKATFPRNAVQEFERARRERLEANQEGARKRLEKLLAQYPDFYDARNALGSVYLEMKRFREAETQYNAARRLRPNSAAPLVSLGSLYVQEADASLNPGSGVLIVGADLGVILDDAGLVLTEAIRIKPDASFAYYLLGVAYMQGQNYTKSEQNFRKALELESQLRWARIGLGNLYLKQAKLREALVEFDLYLEQFKKVQNRPEVQKVRDKIAALLVSAPK